MEVYGGIFELEFELYCLPIFGGINLYLFIPFHFKKYRVRIVTDILYFIAYLYGNYLLFQTDSRNIMLAQCMVILILIFKKIITKK